MASAAMAQRLPQPILDCIAHWLSPKLRGLIEYSYGYRMRCKLLVPLLGVCCAWRRTFAQLFYRAVLLKVPMLGRPYISNDSMPTLQDAVDSGYGMYVREIVIRLSSISYNFVYTKQHQNPLHVVQSCGQLPSVRGLNFHVEPVQKHRLKDYAMSYNLPDHPDSNIELYEPGRIADLFCSVVDSVMAGMPNIRDVSVHGSDASLHMYHADSESDKDRIGNNVYTDPAVVTDALQRIYDKAFSTISTRVTHAAFSNRKAAEHLSFCPQIDSLTGITAHSAGPSNHVSELIRRNSGSLVRLDIDNADDLDIALLISSRINPGEMCVYPRLKELCARGITMTDNASLPQLLVNPFPALEVLHCGKFPMPIAVLVLRENRARLCEATLYDSVVSEVLRDKWAAEEGEFPILTKLSLPRLYPGSHLDIYELLGHCPKLSVLNVHAMIAVDERPVPHNPLSKLQSLNISSTRCTVNEAAAIICACPWLMNARIIIHRRGDSEACPQSDTDIKAFLEKYRGHRLHLHSLQLRAAGHPSTCLVCEDSVLLTALFPTINRVAIAWFSSRRRFDNTRYIQEELARSVYRDIVHLKSVNFSTFF